jgi:hypothetical protein
MRTEFIDTLIIGGGQAGPDVRFGSKADICSAKGHVRFASDSDRESGHPQKVMSALPSKADMCAATRDVRYGPNATVRAPKQSRSPFDHIGGGRKRLLWRSRVTELLSLAATTLRSWVRQSGRPPRRNHCTLPPKASDASGDRTHCRDSLSDKKGRDRSRRHSL